MFLFQSSQISSVISSFERFREHSKLCSQSQTKAFASLHNWAIESNNSAIQDVSGKLADLFVQEDLNNDKNYSLKDIVQMFKRFKELDSKNQQLQMQARLATKFEKRCLQEVEKCPTYKNIRDFELKHQKAQTARETAEVKHYEAAKESEMSKTILFKTHMKRLNDELLRQNEAERVLLTAMSDLIQQIPDVSCAPEQDQNDINYSNFDKTKKICVKARKQLSRLSLSTPPVAAKSEDEEEQEVKAVKAVKTKRARPGRLSCPPMPSLAEPARLYPKLETTAECWSDESALCPPPPTYSDSESMSSLRNNRFIPSYRRVAPSAPVFEERTEQNRLQKSESRNKLEAVALNCN